MHVEKEEEQEQATTLLAGPSYLLQSRAFSFSQRARSAGAAETWLLRRSELQLAPVSPVPSVLKLDMAATWALATAVQRLPAAGVARHGNAGREGAQARIERRRTLAL